MTLKALLGAAAIAALAACGSPDARADRPETAGWWTAFCRARKR